MAVNQKPPVNAEYPRRLREALAYRGKTVRDVSRVIGMGETPLGKIFNGDSVPSSLNLDAICEALQVHPSWALKGFLPKYYEDAHPQTAARKPGPSRSTGLDRWLAKTRDGEVTTEARNWLELVPWIDPQVEQPDAVYRLLLLAFNQMTMTSQSSTTLEPVTSPTNNNRVG
jgi:transcriptional regulator with XRE-family HTH domain